MNVLDRVHNDIIRQKCETSFIAEIIRERRLHWLGHVGRMGNERLPQRMLFARTEEGRPRKSLGQR